jgi:general secretion pathway protein E/type IV pilus assembly protein PilB
MRLSDRLLAAGLVTPDQLSIALEEQKATGKMLGEVLSGLGFVEEDVVREFVASALGRVSVNMKQIVADPAALNLVPKALALRHSVYPVSYDPSTKLLVMASARPNDIVSADQIRAQVGEDIIIEWRLANAPDILTCLEQFYGRALSIEGILREIDTGKADPVAANQRADGYEHPVVRLVDALLRDAVSREASDIHLEPESQFLRVRYRIDGVLRQVLVLHSKHWSAMLVRLKVMANMNIAEAREAQDGRISLSVAGRTVDFRAAAQPTVHGENFVLRVLDRKRNVAGIDELGLSASQFKTLEDMLARPEGILLVTGPTGSGKTTTLYSLLNHLNRPGVNIMTLEDPVEYPLPMVRQTAIGATGKMSFADGIRSLMRQDPDIILVGEMRDTETGEMAFRAAMTGHQVFSTLHTNSAIRSIPRLIDMGIQPHIMSGNIIGVIAQRLVRRLCERCKTPCAPPPEVTAMLASSNQPCQTYQAKGCPTCDFLGYKGRIALMEVFKFDTELDDMVQRRATLKEMHEYAVSMGFVPLFMDGLRRVCEGITTVDEVRRVVEVNAEGMS